MKRLHNGSHLTLLFSSKEVKSLERPVEPVQRPVEPVQRPVEPLKRPVEPLKRPVGPLKRPVGPSVCAQNRLCKEDGRKERTRGAIT
uniref:Uncharacterized protein n=1 Tax=Chromera velia CCMP2878 TaxID=1169474 RepID=A0A0G4F5A6_9ALVE|eukprot:Cvel_15243.t1-p1 / transcript=Cvel_15243.t1 / gene=Cvel_15243 / organism=Chromera_velia_CCMP2878 / gene_product=hypothetical protein / transcript_product=hypothetical protein / location=Cvel_scaffold1116:26381-31187(+) / protein_length=86 / sequence_SO=supercontig / SO=protein_coding / is_pseudo=false